MKFLHFWWPETCKDRSFDGHAVKQLLINGNRSYTVAFRYPGNLLYFTSKYPVVFKNSICSGLAISLTSSFSIPFEWGKHFVLFFSTQVLQFAKNSNKEVDHGMEPKHLWSTMQRVVPHAGPFIDDDVHDDISDKYNDLFENCHQ